MPRLRYNPARSAPYNGASGTWAPGDEREVSDEAAKWLLSLEDWFAEVKPAPKAEAPVVEGPKATRAYTQAKKK
jgi:hypothetical protein